MQIDVGHGEYLADASSGVDTIETVSAAGSRDEILHSLRTIFLLMRIYASDDIYCIHVQYNCHFLCEALHFFPFSVYISFFSLSKCFCFSRKSFKINVTNKNSFTVIWVSSLTVMERGGVFRLNIVYQTNLTLFVIYYTNGGGGGGVEFFPNPNDCSRGFSLRHTFLG